MHTGDLVMAMSEQIVPRHLQNKMRINMRKTGVTLLLLSLLGAGIFTRLIYKYYQPVKKLEIYLPAPFWSEFNESKRIFIESLKNKTECPSGFHVSITCSAEAYGYYFEVTCDRDTPPMNFKKIEIQNLTNEKKI